MHFFRFFQKCTFSISRYLGHFWAYPRTMGLFENGRTSSFQIRQFISCSLENGWAIGEKVRPKNALFPFFPKMPFLYLKISRPFLGPTQELWGFLELPKSPLSKLGRIFVVARKMADKLAKTWALKSERFGDFFSAIWCNIYGKHFFGATVH